MEIKLTPVFHQEISEVLALWSKDRNLDGDAQQVLLSKNPPSQFRDLLTRKNDEPSPIRTILSIVHRRYSAFGIFEHPYLDLEFWDSYVGFYGTCFSDTPRECKRLHLFSGDETKVTELIELLKDGKTQQQIVEAGFEYRGYCVFRPISSNVVGRCAIEFDSTPTADLLKKGLDLREAKDGRPFLKVEQLCKSVLLNTEFRFKAAEFIQQDPQLGQCATASLWVATNVAAKKFGSKQVKFPTITKNAMGQKLPNNPLAYQSADPNSALTAIEIKNALAAAGSMYLSERSSREPKNYLHTCMKMSHFIYSYVESGLPVILCMDAPKGSVGHAVAAVGHFLPSAVETKQVVTLDKIIADEQYAKDAAEDFAMHAIASNLIDLYNVHDDCYGPYRRLRVLLDDGKGRRKKCICQSFGIKPEEPAIGGLKARLGRGTVEYRVRDAIVPVHFRIRHNAWDSLFASIREFNWYIRKSDTALNGDEIFLWRSFLTSGSDFKKTLSEKKRNYPATFRAFYASLHLPKYIWVHELTQTSLDNINNCFPQGNGSREIDGEFIVDATTAKNDIHIISARVAEKIWCPELDAPIKIAPDVEMRKISCFEQRYVED